MYFKANKKKRKGEKRGKEEGRKETMLSVRPVDGRIDASRPAESMHATIFLRPLRREQWQPSRARLAFESDQRVRGVKCSREMAVGIGESSAFPQISDRPRFANAFLRTGRFDRPSFRLDPIDFRSMMKECRSCSRRKGDGRYIYALKDFYRNLDLGCVNACGENWEQCQFHIFSY